MLHKNALVLLDQTDIAQVLACLLRGHLIVDGVVQAWLTPVQVGTDVSLSKLKLLCFQIQQLAFFCSVVFEDR